MNVFTSLAMSCLNVWKREFVFNDVQHHGGCGFTTCHKMMQNLICFRAMPTSVIKFTVIIFGKYARLLSPVIPFIHVLRVCVPIYTYFALFLWCSPKQLCGSEVYICFMYLPPSLASLFISFSTCMSFYTGYSEVFLNFVC